MGVERFWFSTCTPKCSAFQKEWKMDLWTETGGRRNGSDAVDGCRCGGCQVIWHSWIKSFFFWLPKTHHYNNPVSGFIGANLESLGHRGCLAETETVWASLLTSCLDGQLHIMQLFCLWKLDLLPLSEPLVGQEKHLEDSHPRGHCGLTMPVCLI